MNLDLPPDRLRQFRLIALSLMAVLIGAVIWLLRRKR